MYVKVRCHLKRTLNLCSPDSANRLMYFIICVFILPRVHVFLNRLFVPIKLESICISHARRNASRDFDASFFIVLEYQPPSGYNNYNIAFLCTIVGRYKSVLYILCTLAKLVVNDK